MRVAAAIAPRPEPALPPGFAELYAEHYDFVWRCALRLGVPADDVDDVVQECFVIALRRFAGFDPGGHARASTWLFAILRNVQRNHARSARRRAARLELLARTDAATTEPPRADTALAGRLLDEFLASLDADKRAAFVLAEIEGMTGPELAHALELNLNTANSRVRAARRAFAQHFDGDSRELARAQLRRSANDRGPEPARHAGLSALVTLAGGSEIKVALGLSALASKWIAGLIFAAASVGAVAIVASGKPAREPAEPRVASVRTAATTLAEPVREPPTASTPIVADDPPSDEAALAQAPPRQRPRAEPSPLDRIAKARAALLERDPAAALAWVEDQTFPAQFEGHRVALEVAALCGLDRSAQAQRRAQTWRAEHPDDPTAAELRDVCWSESSHDR